MAINKVSLIRNDLVDAKVNSVVLFKLFRDLCHTVRTKSPFGNRTLSSYELIILKFRICNCHLNPRISFACRREF